MFIDLLPDYESPSIHMYAIQNEGFLCASGKHDPFKEDDGWMDMWEDYL